MTKLYMVRHCEAMGNLKRLFQGSTDLDISDMGAKQLEYLAKRFKDVKIDRVYSSPLIRAQKTAHAIADQKALKVELLDDLCELHGGVVEGKPFIETFNTIPGLADTWDNHVEGKPFIETFNTIPGLADTWDNHPQDFAPEGGETMRHAYERIFNAVNFIARENKGKSVAAATHGGVLRCLNCRLLKGSINDLKNIPWSENTAVTLLNFDDNFNITVEYINDVSHLPEDLIPKRSRLSSFMKDVK